MNIRTILAVLGLVFLPAISNAELSLDGSSNDVSLFYVAPRVNERVADANALLVRQASTEAICYTDFRKSGTPSVQQMFDKIVPNSGNYQVLQVVRVFTGDSQLCAVFWFTFIEKSRSTPAYFLPSSGSLQ